MKPSSIDFHFRAETIRDEAGKAIGKKEKVPSLKLQLNTLESEDLLSIIEAGGAGLTLLLEAANDIIYQAMRDVITDAIETKKALNQELADANSAAIEWNAIANRPKAERRGSGISKEDLEAFVEDYVQVMSMVQAEKKPEAIATAASHISKRFANCRFNKPVIKILQGYLATWYASTSNKEDFATIYEAFDNRATVLLNADEAGKLAEAI